MKKYSFTKYFLIILLLFLLFLYFRQNRFLIDSNFVVAIGTFLLVIVAYSQLEKITKQNEAQIIFHLEEEWNNKILSKRKECAHLFSRWLENKNLIKASNEKDWSNIQEKIEGILDFYEKIAGFVEDGSLSISTVYNLYSYYIQGYWELAEKSGFIEKDRKSHEGGGDLYILTQNLYLKILKEGALKEFSEDGLKKFCEEEI
jgi:hypothetical protein